MENNGELMSVESSVNQALTQITKAEIDQQIATAHQYPRSLSTFKRRAVEMATLDEETAASCIYSRPVGKKDGKTEYAEGLSIRTAEIVGACYGNLRVGAMIVEMNPRYVKARGMAHDLETNFASTSEVIESTVDKYGKPYSERMRVVVAKACLSKARRDATFSVVPRALCKPIEAAARQVAIGDATTLDKRRAGVMAWIGKLGIDPARVFAALSVSGESDLTIEHLTTLTGLKTSIRDGDTTIDEAFPQIADSAKSSAESSAAASAAARAAEKARKPAAVREPENVRVDEATGEVLRDNHGAPTYPELRKRAEAASSREDCASIASDGAHLPDDQQEELFQIAVSAAEKSGKF